MTSICGLLTFPCLVSPGDDSQLIAEVHCVLLRLGAGKHGFDPDCKVRVLLRELSPKISDVSGFGRVGISPSTGGKAVLEGARGFAQLS